MDNAMPPRPPTRQLPERNPVAHAAHRKQVFWQITLPFVLLLLVFLALVVGVSWSAVNASGQLRRWADVAIIWQMPLPLLLSLICLVANIGMAFVLFKVMGVLPGYARLLHNIVLLIQSKIIQIGDRLAAPFIKVDSLNTSARTGWRALRKK